MAKVKKFAAGGVSSLGKLLGSMPVSGAASQTPSIGGGVSASGGGGSAQDGLGQIDAGAGTVRNAINAAQGALGGGGGKPQLEFKKGGAVKKYTSSDGRLNLRSVGASTVTKNKSKSNW